MKSAVFLFLWLEFWKCSFFLQKGIRKFLFFLQTKNFLITTYIIFFCDWELKNLYFSCKLKLAVFYFWIEFWKYSFFPQKGIRKFSLFFVIRYLLRIIPANISFVRPLADDCNMQLAELQKNYTSMVPALEQISAQEVQSKYCKNVKNLKIRKIWRNFITCND